MELHEGGFVKGKIVRTEKVNGGTNRWSSSEVRPKKQGGANVFVEHLSNTEAI